MEFPIDHINRFIHDDLTAWVAGNPKLRLHITRHDLFYLFEFPHSRAVTIDLCRFAPEYQQKVFANGANLMHINAFVRKVCMVIKRTLVRLGRTDIDITITVKHNISSSTYWRSYLIHQHMSESAIAPVNPKY